MHSAQNWAVNKSRQFSATEVDKVLRNDIEMLGTTELAVLVEPATKNDDFHCFLIRLSKVERINSPSILPLTQYEQVYHVIGRFSFLLDA